MVIILFHCEYKASQASLWPLPLPGVGNMTQDHLVLAYEINTNDYITQKHEILKF